MQGKAGKTRGGKRLDQLLVDLGLAATVVEAQALIMAGKVLVGEQRVDKPGHSVRQGQPVRVKDQGSRFVSRGGDKLAAALAELGLESAVKGATVLDVGASTGGFTDCCLQLGAARVIALDVGTAQLAWELRQDPRVTVLERTDIRDFVPTGHPEVDFVVADISFNSLARLAPALKAAAPRAGVHFLVLVKPQFELPRGAVPVGGVVTVDADREAAVAQAAAAFLALGLPEGIAMPSQLSGRSGNREIFYYVRAALSEP